MDDLKEMLTEMINQGFRMEQIMKENLELKKRIYKLNNIIDNLDMKEKLKNTTHRKNTDKATDTFLLTF